MDRVVNPFEPSRVSFGPAGGFTLLEMLVALFILSVSILGLTGTILTSIQVNLRNDLRNNAVLVSSAQAGWVMNQPIDSLDSGDTVRVVRVRGAEVPYAVSWIVETLSADTRQVQIRVAYPYRGETFRNDTVVYKHRGN